MGDPVECKYWRCASLSCTVTATTSGDTVLKIKHEHQHGTSMFDKTMSLFRTKVRGVIDSDPFMSCKATFDTFILYFLHIFHLRSDNISILPRCETVKSFIYNEKHRHNPSSSDNLYDFVFD